MKHTDYYKCRTKDKALIHIASRLGIEKKDLPNSNTLRKLFKKYQEVHEELKISEEKKITKGMLLYYLKLP